jgi:hypothetical protein
MVAVVMPPSPIFLLFSGRNLAEVAMGVAMGFRRPLIVVDDFVVIPHVIVGVVGIVNAIVVVSPATESEHGQRHSGG